ncbi:MAG: UDP-N-acetylmuramate dehydrogenase [Patescibacteria group bacterium]
MGIRENVSLKNYTTFRIGGKARYFFVAKNKNEVIKAIEWAKNKNLPFFILGGGSNLLVSDKGYNGLVIKIQNSNLKIQNYNSKSKIICEAGRPLSSLVEETAKNNLTGIEWAAGIPGTVGGAIRGNAGAFGGSIADAVKLVEALDIKTAETRFLKNKDCRFEYRNSIFKQNKNLIIISAEFEFLKGVREKIKEKIKEHLDYRNQRHPKGPSAGSIFKNPEGFFARNLILECGLGGRIIGDVAISREHANFIINLGGGQAEDVLKLIKLIKQKVKNKFGVKLEEEIQYL